jgi:hypothetical protein
MEEPYQVLVSITLSKEFTVHVNKNGDREIEEGDVRLEKWLPDEILRAVANQDKHTDIDPLSYMKRDAADWVIDELTVMEL